MASDPNQTTHALTCNGCGEGAVEFREGWCIDCFTDRQRALDLHNAEFDRWDRMTDHERRDEIRRAASNAR